MPPPLSTPYVEVEETVRIAPAVPTAPDPELVESANQTHRRAQNGLFQRATARGYHCFRPGAGEPDFDVAWRTSAGRLVVAEVKSITAANERHQLRAGLGQVLEYRHRLRRLHAGEVVAVIVLPGPPLDPMWAAITVPLGVTLTWPPDYPNLAELETRAIV